MGTNRVIWELITQGSGLASILPLVPPPLHGSHGLAERQQDFSSLLSFAYNLFQRLARTDDNLMKLLKQHPPDCAGVDGSNYVAFS